TAEVLYALANSLRYTIENPKTKSYPATLVIYNGGKGLAATRLIVGAWKKSSKKTEDFVHGKIRIGKAKRTRIPGSNDYVLGDVDKGTIKLLAKDYKEQARLKKTAVKRMGKAQTN
ncbi:MAG: hypothetical protein HYS26_00630, partial [Candidatus Kaiserbacteria bacterium]